jgi:transketolase
VRDAFARAVYEIAKEDPRVFVVVADISPASAMAPFVKEFPDRFLNAGLAEQTMIGVCAGLAMRGCTAFAYTIATFAIYRPFEQVRDDLCYQNLPVTIVGIGGGTAYSLLGGTHHAQEDVAIMGALPNMSIVAPCDPLETTAAALACARRRQGPIYLRLGKAGEPALTANAVEPFEFGKLRMLREGRDVCIVSYGPIMKMAFDIADRIAASDGRSVAVASAHTLKPFDREGMARIFDRFETVVVIEDHSERGGLAADVKQLAWERRAKSALHTFSLRDEFIHVYGSQHDLWRAHGLTPERILDSVRTRAARSL